MNTASSSPATAAATPTTPVRVWDLPLRVFHWALLAAVAVAIVTGQIGGDWMPVHGRAGVVVVGLLAFRFVWGLVGSPTARFWQFAPTPGRLRAYLGGRWQGLGHNPLGALSVFALLGLLAAQVGTGLFGNDEIAFTGPLNVLVSEAQGIRLTGWHKELADLLFVLLGLHVAAIVFHRVVKQHNLVRPMVTGWAEATPAEAATLPAAGKGLFAAGGPVALLLALGVAFTAMWVASGGPWQAGGAAQPGAVPTATAPAAAAAPASAASPAARAASKADWE